MRKILGATFLLMTFSVVVPVGKILADEVSPAMATWLYGEHALPVQ